MIKAQHIDKHRIVDILVKSFGNSRTVNYIIKPGKKRELRIKRLMRYAYEKCRLFGDVFITNDLSGCALIVKPEQKKNSLRSLLLDIKFAITCLGFSNLKKALTREAKIKRTHPGGLLYYVWFIGVDPGRQHQGIGSRLLNAVISEAEKEKRTICLETSTLKNIRWYQSFGFNIYHELDFGYTLFCLKKE